MWTICKMPKVIKAHIFLLKGLFCLSLTFLHSAGFYLQKYEIYMYFYIHLSLAQLKKIGGLQQERAPRVKTHAKATCRTCSAVATPSSVLKLKKISSFAGMASYYLHIYSLATFYIYLI